jgi:DNA gyrase/topoisomerase IV subunit B
MCYHDGVAEAALSEIGPANGRTEAKITFVPSRQFFAQPRFDFSVIDRYVGKVTSLGQGLRIRLTDDR